MKRFLLSLFFLSCYSNIVSDSSVDDIKGIGTSIWSALKSVPSGFVSFWKSIKRLGAAPGDYYYQYLIFNDTDQSVWVAGQTMRSIMGAVFPQAHGWSCQEVPAYSMYPATASITISSSSASSKAQAQSLAVVKSCGRYDYYAEMFIKTTDNKYSNHMPYLEHDDVLSQIDKLNLSPDDKNSNHCDIYRIYMGKDLSAGQYVHSLKSEVVGSISTSSTAYKNAISMDSKVQSITIKNSTNQDYYVGFFPTTTSQATATVSAAQCVFLGLVEKNSFGLLATTGSIKSFQPGIIAVFSSLTSTSPVVTKSVPKYSFNSLSYTLDIYQQPGQKQINCDWQGIMPGHYDMPCGRIRDITPIIGAFWYQSAGKATSKSNQVSGYDLPGTVWIISYENNSKITKILAQATPGQYVQFQIERAAIDDKKNIYFLYSDANDATKISLFIQNFTSGKIGASILDNYEKKLDSVMNSSSMFKINDAKKQSKDMQKGAKITNIVNEIALNAMQLERGQIVDPESGVTAFLLGIDVVMPFGMGADPLYYVLSPSLLPTLPTGAIQNSMSSSPKGLPTTIVNSTYAPIKYSIAAGQ